MPIKHSAIVEDGAEREPAKKRKLSDSFDGRRASRRAEFLLALKKWERATARINGQPALIAHPSSVELMNMDGSIEFMVKAVTRQPSVLVFLLQKKTGKRPYEGIEPGDLTAMSKSWADWYRDQTAK